jgi:hypothetical protein
MWWAIYLLIDLQKGRPHTCWQVGARFKSRSLPESHAVCARPSALCRLIRDEARRLAQRAGGNLGSTIDVPFSRITEITAKYNIKVIGGGVERLTYTLGTIGIHMYGWVG